MWNAQFNFRNTFTRSNSLSCKKQLALNPSSTQGWLDESDKGKMSGVLLTLRKSLGMIRPFHEGFCRWFSAWYVLVILPALVSDLVSSFSSMAEGQWFFMSEHVLGENPAGLLRPGCWNAFTLHAFVIKVGMVVRRWWCSLSVLKRYYQLKPSLHSHCQSAFTSSYLCCISKVYRFHALLLGWWLDRGFKLLYVHLQWEIPSRGWCMRARLCTDWWCTILKNSSKMSENKNDVGYRSNPIMYSPPQFECWAEWQGKEVCAAPEMPRDICKIHQTSVR